MKLLLGSRVVVVAATVVVVISVESVNVVVVEVLVTQVFVVIAESPVAAMEAVGIVVAPSADATAFAAAVDAKMGGGLAEVGDVASTSAASSAAVVLATAPLATSFGDMASKMYERVMVANPLSASNADLDVEAAAVDPVLDVVEAVAAGVVVVVEVVLVVVVLVVGTSAGSSMRSISVRQPRRLCK